jgi:hypothetical protein
MTDFLTAKIKACRGNIDRYSRILATKLTSLERAYIHERIGEQRAELRRLEAEADAPLDQAVP